MTKKNERVVEQIDTLTQKQNRIENQIKSLEQEKRKEEKISNLEPYICKAALAFYMRKNPNIT